MYELMYAIGNILVVAASSLWCHRRVSADIAPFEAAAKNVCADGKDPDLAFRAAIDVMRSNYGCTRRWCPSCWVRARYLRMAYREFVSQ